MRKLTFRESAGLDAARLARLYRCLGERQADTVICEAMESMALALARVARAHEADDLTTLTDQALALEDIGRKIGLSKLHRVAGDVLACAAAGTSARVALDATVARLGRVGDISLTAIWDPKDLTL